MDTLGEKFGEEWSCPTCTLINAPIAPACEACATERPGANQKRREVAPGSVLAYFSVPVAQAPEVLASGYKSGFDHIPCVFDVRIAKNMFGGVAIEVSGLDGIIDVENGHIRTNFIPAENLCLALEVCKYGTRCCNMEPGHRQQFRHPEPTFTLREALTENEPETDGMSATTARPARGQGGMPYAFIAPPAPSTSMLSRMRGSRKLSSLPTILAISGEEQLHVSTMFRSWRAEILGWQMVVPLRPKQGTPYLFDTLGAELVVNFMREVLRDKKLLPHCVEAGKFHLVGTSNGAASVLAVAASAPELVASLNLIGGFMPECLADPASLRAVKHIHMYAGDQDQTGCLEALTQLKELLHGVSVSAEVHILEGAGHGTIGEFIDRDAFWAVLSEARSELTQ